MRRAFHRASARSEFDGTLRDRAAGSGGHFVSESQQRTPLPAQKQRTLQHGRAGRPMPAEARAHARFTERA
ncbi:hypothetical protein BLAT2472_30297 [Burkholderia latens]